MSERKLLASRSFQSVWKSCRHWGLASENPEAPTGFPWVSPGLLGPGEDRPTPWLPWEIPSCGNLMNFWLENVIFLPCSLHRKLEEEKAVGATYCERLDDLLQQSDFVMLAVSLTPQTQRLIGRRELRLMKPTAILVNIGRGTCSTVCVWDGVAGKSCGRNPSGCSLDMSSQLFSWMAAWSETSTQPGGVVS